MPTTFTEALFIVLQLDFPNKRGISYKKKIVLIVWKIACKCMRCYSISLFPLQWNCSHFSTEADNVY